MFLKFCKKKVKFKNYFLKKEEINLLNKKNEIRLIYLIKYQLQKLDLHLFS